MEIPLEVGHLKFESIEEAKRIGYMCMLVLEYDAAEDHF